MKQILGNETDIFSPKEAHCSEYETITKMFFKCVDSKTAVFSPKIYRLKNETMKEMFSKRRALKKFYDIVEQNGSGYTEMWSLAISQVTNILQEQTNNILIKDLFLYLIQFTKIANEYHDFKLVPIITLLEAMKAGKHPMESKIWNYVISNSHRKVVFPYAKFSTEKEVSVEQGFNIVNLFLMDLYFLIEPKAKKEDCFDDCFILLVYGYEYPAEWNEAVFRVTKISKEQRKKINIPLEIIFSCLIEFAKIFHKRWDYTISYLINILEAISKDPHAFPAEIKLWKEVVDDSYGIRSLWNVLGCMYEEFDWESELPDKEKY